MTPESDFDDCPAGSMAPWPRQYGSSNARKQGRSASIARTGGFGAREIIGQFLGRQGQNLSAVPSSPVVSARGANSHLLQCSELIPSPSQSSRNYLPITKPLLGDLTRLKEAVNRCLQEGKAGMLLRFSKPATRCSRETSVARLRDREPRDARTLATCNRVEQASLTRVERLRSQPPPVCPNSIR